jgi:hypothetical protein
MKVGKIYVDSGPYKSLIPIEKKKMKLLVVWNPCTGSDLCGYIFIIFDSKVNFL